MLFLGSMSEIDTKKKEVRYQSRILAGWIEK